LAIEDELRAAQARISELEGEIDQLHGRFADIEIVRKLQSRLTSAAAASRLNPNRDGALLEQIVETAMQTLRATAASLYLLEGQDLVFEVALGPNARALVGQRISSDRGIAGWVAATGQGIAVADVQQDPRWARDIAQGIGYAPSSMAVAPLLANETVIGVMQLLDRADGQPFDNADLELLGQFAAQAAAAIDQSRQLSSISLLLRGALRNLVDSSEPDAIEAEAQEFAARLQNRPEYEQTMELADILGRISQADDDTRRLCLEIAGALASYLERRSGYAAGRGY
jgi:GAF domain-containing protein